MVDRSFRHLCDNTGFCLLVWGMEDEEEFARFVLKVLRLMITHEQAGWWMGRADPAWPRSRPDNVRRQEGDTGDRVPVVQRWMVHCTHTHITDIHSHPSYLQRHASIHTSNIIFFIQQPIWAYALHTLLFKLHFSAEYARDCIPITQS